MQLPADPQAPIPATCLEANHNSHEIQPWTMGGLHPRHQPCHLGIVPCLQNFCCLLRLRSMLRCCPRNPLQKLLVTHPQQRARGHHGVPADNIPRKHPARLLQLRASSSSPHLAYIPSRAFQTNMSRPYLRSRMRCSISRPTAVSENGGTDGYVNLSATTPSVSISLHARITSSHSPRAA
jgi:hypothetical protein